jgi:hypothetical protein
MTALRSLTACSVTALVLLLGSLCGCGPSRNIRDLQPPPQPRLEELESHLDYVDPDEGRPSYVVRPAR